MLAVMEADRVRSDVGIERVVGVGQGRKGDGHGRSVVPVARLAQRSPGESQRLAAARPLVSANMRRVGETGSP